MWFQPRGTKQGSLSLEEGYLLRTSMTSICYIYTMQFLRSRVFRFNPKKHKQQISNTIEAFNLDVSCLGKKKFPSKLMGRGRASALKVNAHTYKCQKINFFKYRRVLHQKKRLESLMNEQKSVLQNIENCRSNGKKNHEKSHFLPFCPFLTGF